MDDVAIPETDTIAPETTPPPWVTEAVVPTPPADPPMPPPADTALYRVKAGQQLPHLGMVLPAGASVRLSTTVATDPVVAFRIEPVTGED